MRYHPLFTNLSCIGFLVLAVVGTPGAFCDEISQVKVAIELSVNPDQPTISADTLLHVKFANFGVGALNTFVPEVNFQDHSIFVSLQYLSPEIELTPPFDLRFEPEETITLGRLDPGTYNVTAVFLSEIDVPIGSAELAFTVVPEPSTTSLIGAVVFVGGIALRGKKIPSDL